MIETTAIYVQIYDNFFTLSNKKIKIYLGKNKISMASFNEILLNCSSV